MSAKDNKQWNEIQKAMASFTYFEDWDESLVQECCSLSKINVYCPEQTILGDGIGLPDFVYFILKGNCRVVEDLLVTSQRKCDRTIYKLYDPSPPTENILEQRSTASKGPRKVQLENKTLPTDINEGDTMDSKLSEQVNGKVQSESRLSIIVSAAISANKLELTENTVPVQPSTSTKGTTGPPNLTSRSEAHKANPALPPYVKTHFMQVCILHRTSCFCIGENMAHRRVIAVTVTECLLIPRYWLIQRKKGNIWNRVLLFLNSHIPTTQQVFQVFVSDRKWLQYRKKVLKELLAEKKLSSNNSKMNIPYHTRINC